MTDNAPAPSEPAPPTRPVSEPAPVSEPRPVSEPGPASPAAPGPARKPVKATPAEKRRPWWLVVVLAVLATPPVVVILMNLSGVTMPKVTEGMRVLVNVPAKGSRGGTVGFVNPEGAQKLLDLIAEARPSMNPWTIYTVSREHRRLDRVATDSEGLPIPKFHAEAWAVIMVPVAGFEDEYYAYHYRQDGDIAYVDGPDGDQVLVMSITPQEFHAEMVKYKISALPPTPTTRE